MERAALSGRRSVLECDRALQVKGPLALARKGASVLPRQGQAIWPNFLRFISSAQAKRERARTRAMVTPVRSPGVW